MFQAILPRFALLASHDPQSKAELWSRMMDPAPSPIGDEAQAQEQARLLAAMAIGEQAALAQLYDSLAKPLYSLAFRVLNNASEAQDVVQDVFVQLWKKASSYEQSRGSVFSWAVTLTRNRAIDRVRMRKRRAELLAESAPDIQPMNLNGGHDSAHSLWLQEKAAAVRGALAQLGPDQQKAIELAYFSGLTQQEIAVTLNAPLGTIKARIRRGLRQLREIIPFHL